MTIDALVSQYVTLGWFAGSVGGCGNNKVNNSAMVSFMINNFGLICSQWYSLRRKIAKAMMETIIGNNEYE
jgi:hypothetical protein